MTSALALSLAACAPAEPPAAPAAPAPAETSAPAPDHHHHHHDHDHGGPLVHRFQSADQWAKEFDDPARDAWQHPADVIAALKITPGMSVADIGAGTGYFLHHLSAAVGPTGKVAGLDIEADMVRYMKDRIGREGLRNADARVVALDDPQIAAESVDRVLIVDTWHHIAGRQAYAAKLRAALKPGGAVFIVDFKKEAHRGPPPEHRLAPEQVMDELRQGGLSPEMISAALPEQYIVAGRRP